MLRLTKMYNTVRFDYYSFKNILHTFLNTVTRSEVVKNIGLRKVKICFSMH